MQRYGRHRWRLEENLFFKVRELKKKSISRFAAACRRVVRVRKRPRNPNQPRSLHSARFSSSFPSLPLLPLLVPYWPALAHPLSETPTNPTTLRVPVYAGSPGTTSWGPIGKAAEPNSVETKLGAVRGIPCYCCPPCCSAARPVA